MINKYLETLYKLERVNVKYDLKNITHLLKHLGNPHRHYKSIHIAGTNGKGATASYISSILTEHGLKTGLYTSPHIIKFNERIRINGKKIPDDYIINFLDKNIKIIKKIKASFFEVTTALAFKYFSDCKIDVAVIETGMGGKLDSTNVIESEIAIITQIDFDHKKYLGNTLRKIAGEKIGIVKKNSHTIVSDSNTSLKRFFKQKLEPLKTCFLDEEAIYNSKYITIYRNNTSYRYLSPLHGKFQIRNAACAILACLIFTCKNKIELNKDLTEKGLKKIKENSGYLGRIEKLKWMNKKLILDVSHNPAAIYTTLNSLKPKPDLIVFASMKDKDFRTSIKHLTKYAKDIIFTEISYYRSAKVEKLLSFGKIFKTNYNKKLMAINSVNEVKSYILNSKFRNILFIGSFFLISEVIEVFRLHKLLKNYT